MILDLDARWMLHEAPLDWGAEKAADVLNMREGWLPAPLPCDVRMALIAAGLIRDPVKAGYYEESRWVEDRSWWFRCAFDGAELPSCDKAALELGSLDCHADIFLNGEPVGHQASVHYPFVKDILPLIRKGTNTLLVRLTCGLERVDDEAPAELGWCVCMEGERRPDRGDMRRAFVRKPQYAFGWDWCPRVASAAVTKGARIVCGARVAIQDVHIYTERIDGGAACVHATVAVRALPALETIPGDITIELRYGGEIVASARAAGRLLASGLNYVDFGLALPGAKLWWPNGMGGQPLYEVRSAVKSGDAAAEHPKFRFGVRTVSLDTSPDADGGRRFRFVVNGAPVMAKGGNWIPADVIYARVTDEKYRALVQEAKEANFTMLRVWGGGLYEADAFYDACDEAGILLWHDFMFACSAYPDHREDFLREAERELDFQTKRLRNHPSLALWCGNNENQQIFEEAMRRPGASLGLKLYNETAPEAVRRNCPEIPYWPSSPFGGAAPNAADAGDRHVWGDFMMHADMERRISPEGYDALPAKFVSEYGYPGPPVRASVEEYFDGMPVDRAGKIWDAHNNTYEQHTVMAGIRKHYTDRALDLDGYLLWASLTQALMLGYSLEALRAKPGCAGALFWMFDDCWGEVGWTIVDYYLRRKPSYWAVKRAFDPVKLIVRRDGADAVVTGCNDTGEAVRFPADAGWFPLNGAAPRLTRVMLELPARSRGEAVRLPIGPGDEASELWAVRPAEGSGALPAMLRLAAWKDMRLPPCRVSVESAARDGDALLVTVRSDAFAHAVRFGMGSARLSDEWFDLLPGERRTVRVEGFTGRAGDIRPVCLRMDTGI